MRSKTRLKRLRAPPLRYSVAPNKSDCTKKGSKKRSDKQLARAGQSCLDRGLVDEYLEWLMPLLVTFTALFWKCAHLLAP